MNIDNFFESKESYLAFLASRQCQALEQFNDTSEPESKSKKWKLLRLEKVIRLIKENPEYELGFCFNCGEPISANRLASVPESIWCVSCATKHEVGTRHRGGHWHFV